MKIEGFRVDRYEWRMGGFEVDIQMKIGGLGVDINGGWGDWVDIW